MPRRFYAAPLLLSSSDLWNVEDDAAVGNLSYLIDTFDDRDYQLKCAECSLALGRDTEVRCLIEQVLHKPYAQVNRRWRWIEALPAKPGWEPSCLLQRRWLPWWTSWASRHKTGIRWSRWKQRRRAHSQADEEGDALEFSLASLVVIHPDRGHA